PATTGGGGVSALATIAQRADLPIPVWLLAMGAATVLVVTFAALVVLWPEPRLADAPARTVLPRGGRALDLIGGGVGVALFALVVYAGLAGSETVQGNLAPTAVFILLWVGFVPVSVFLGNVWAGLCPWRAVARGARALLSRT